MRLADLLARFDLECVAVDHFRAAPVGDSSLVASQAAVAAARTVAAAGGTRPRLHMHSMHVHHLQAIASDLPTDYEVLRLKATENFHARQILVRQGERNVMSVQASFSAEWQGFAHTDSAPEVAQPEDLAANSIRGRWGAPSPIDVRECTAYSERALHETQRCLWLRANSPLPDNPLVHLGLLVFASSFGVLAAALLRHPELYPHRDHGRSLDHAIWFHGPARVADWVLVEHRAPVAYGGRALVATAMYRRDGPRILSATQEVFLPCSARHCYGHQAHKAMR